MKKRFLKFTSLLLALMPVLSAAEGTKASSGKATAVTELTMQIQAAPKTGDGVHPAQWLALLAVAMLGMVLLYRRGRKVSG